MDELSVLRRERSEFHACVPCVCGWFVGCFLASWWIGTFSCGVLTVGVKCQIACSCGGKTHFLGVTTGYPERLVIGEFSDHHTGLCTERYLLSFPLPNPSLLSLLHFLPLSSVHCIFVGYPFINTCIKLYDWFVPGCLQFLRPQSDGLS